MKSGRELYQSTSDITGDASDLEALWFSSRPAYIARTEGDGWYTVGEFQERINRNRAPLGYKAIAGQLLGMYNAGRLERGQTLVNGKPLICYRVRTKPKADNNTTLLIADASMGVKKVRPKRKRKPPVRKTAIKRKAANVK